jgi:hypothetical protein
MGQRLQYSFPDEAFSKEADNMDANTGTVVVAVGVGIWASVSALLSAAKIINERRDAVLIGKIDKEDLTFEHMWLIVYSDWLSMSGGLVLLKLCTSGAVASLPTLLGVQDTNVTCLAYAASFLLLFSTTTTLIGGCFELKALRRALREKEVTEAAKAQQISRGPVDSQISKN